MRVSSELFEAIRREVCSRRVPEEFRAGHFPEILARSKSFLWGHAIGEEKTEPPKGNAYFIRLGWGLYTINPDYWNCSWRQRVR